MSLTERPPGGPSGLAGLAGHDGLAGGLLDGLLDDGPLDDGPHDGLAGLAGLDGGLQLAVATEPLPEALLTAGERARHDQLAAGSRRRQWRTARAALRTVLLRLGEPSDTAAIAFPHPRYSLSHTPTLAVAAGAPPARTGGLGIDVEPRRPVRLETARFFLTPAERDWLASAPGDRRPGELLRLWTVKEAAFKANPANAGTTLIQYRLDDPSSARGMVTAANFACSYATVVGDFGYLTVAVAPPPR